MCEAVRTLETTVPRMAKHSGHSSPRRPSMHDVRALKNGTMAPDLSGATLTLDTGAGELELAIPAEVLATLEHVAVHLAGEIASRRKAAGLDELVGLPMVENFSVENDAGECLLALAIS